MKSIAVIGSRTFADYDLLEETLVHYQISKLISGGAKGADSLAERYATNHGIELVVFKPDWKKYGRGAGPIRNRDIVDAADLVIAFWDGKSKGTKSALDYAQQKNKQVIIKLIKSP